MTFLYVDDDADDAEIFCAAVAMIDPKHICITVSSGAEALQWLRTISILPDIIIIDVYMQLMDGIECLERIRGTPRLQKIPAILSSSVSTQKTVNKAKSLNAYYLEKATSFDTYVEHLRSAIIELRLGK